MSWKAFSGSSWFTKIILKTIQKPIKSRLMSPFSTLLCFFPQFHDGFFPVFSWHISTHNYTRPHTTSAVTHTVTRWICQSCPNFRMWLVVFLWRKCRFLNTHTHLYTHVHSRTYVYLRQRPENKERRKMVRWKISACNTDVCCERFRKRTICAIDFGVVI